MSEDEELSKLFSLSEKDYGDGYKDKMFEQYRLFVEMIDNLTERRASANNFFLSINTGIFASLGILLQLGIISISTNNYWAIALSIAGILFSYSWYRTVNSHKQLSVMKWKIVWAIEEKLPLLLHKTEWKLLGDGKDKKKYQPLTTIERTIPFLFVAMYGILIIFVFFLK